MTEKDESAIELQNRVELIKQLCNEFESIDVKPGSLKGYSHMIVFRLSIGNMDSNNVAKYCTNVRKSLDMKDLKKRGFFAVLIPTRDPETTVSIINLETMLRIQA